MQARMAAAGFMGQVLAVLRGQGFRQRGAYRVTAIRLPLALG